MIAAAKSLLALLFAVSLLCGTAAPAHAAPMDGGGGAHAMAAPDAHDCGSCDAPADMGCAAMAAHCAAAIAPIGGGAIIDRAAGRADHAAHADLALTGAGPDSDTPPPRG